MRGDIGASQAFAAVFLGGATTDESGPTEKIVLTTQGLEKNTQAVRISTSAFAAYMIKKKMYEME